MSIPAFAAGVDTTALELKFYKFTVSTSPNCSNLTTVIINNNHSCEDFKGIPDLGSGNLAEGTYRYVVIDFSDFIQDVCATGTTSTPISGGAQVNCGNSQDDRVVIYISTAKDAISQNFDPFNPPACQRISDWQVF